MESNFIVENVLFELDEELQYLNLKSYSIVKNIISEEETIFQS